MISDNLDNKLSKKNKDDEKRKIIKKLIEDNDFDIDADYAIREISRIKNEIQAGGGDPVKLVATIV